MEHRLIQGGWEYLPFARSCVAKLKKLGLLYADQSFEVNGVSIKVRIEPGHEYIRIEGGGLELRMDSGVVELFGGIDVESPDSFAPRLLHEAGHAAAYNALFTGVDSNGWRHNPAKTNAGQLSGRITKATRFSGAVPQNSTTAASFAPGIEDTPETDPAVPRYRVNDSAVWGKKQMVNACPASMFTGKCRLYVQALYGAHLYDQTVNGDGTPVSAGTPIPAFVSLHPAPYGGAPSLDLTPYLDEDDKREDITYPTLQLFSGCGVYLDTTTGKHWLVVVGTTSVSIYPMRASSTAEQMRKFLKDGNPTLNATDREHLEAYILSSSQHHARKVQTFSITETPNYSMGYSWHWNWSGDRADIAHNKAIPMGFEGGFNRSGLESTHYSLSLTPQRGGDGQIMSWVVTRGIVSGPSEWSTHNIIWSVYEPSWSTLTPGMENTTPYYGTYRAGGGTFYVYYLRDELQLCKIDVAERAGATTREFSDLLFVDGGLTPYTTVPMFTEGAGVGWYEDTRTTVVHYEAKVTVGGVVIDRMFNNKTMESVRMESGAKSFSEPTPAATAYTGAYYNEFRMDVGYPLYPYPAGEQWGQTPSYGVFSPSMNGAPDSQEWNDPVATFNRVITRKNRVLTSSFAVIIPMYDAEAVFFNYNKTDTATSCETDTATIHSTSWASTYGVRFKISTWVVNPDTGEGGWSWSGTWNVGPNATKYLRATVTEQTLYDNTISTVIPPPEVTQATKLIGKTVTDATINTLAYFHGDDSTPAPAISAWSSASDNAPVVFSPGHITPVNTTEMTNPAVVGWV